VHKKRLPLLEDRPPPPYLKSLNTPLEGADNALNRWTTKDAVLKKW